MQRYGGESLCSGIGVIDDFLLSSQDRMCDDKNMQMNKKCRAYFDGKIVRKDLIKKIKECANVPVYVLEYLLGITVIQVEFSCENLITRF